MFPILLLYGSSLALGLQSLSQGFVIVGSAMRGAGLAVLIVGLMRGTSQPVNGALGGVRGERLVGAGAAFTIVVVSAHMLLTGRGQLPVSPWGSVFTLVAVVYWIRNAESVRRVVAQDDLISITMALGSTLLALLIAAVRTGILVGNTSKYELGEGGVGLANLSTNETAAMAIAPLLWTMRLIESEVPAKSRLGYLAVFSSIAVVLSSGSRVAIAVTAVVLGAFILRGSAGRLRGGRIGVVVAFVGLLVFGATVVRSRTTSEVETFAAGNETSAQFAVPGGERAILWVAYLASFGDGARNRWGDYLVGVGPGGIADLYANSALPSLGITIERTSFYPVHSDLLELLLMTGALGAAGLVMLVVGLLKVPIVPEQRRVALCALFVAGSLGSFDMLQFIPGVVSVLVAAYAASVDTEEWRIFGAIGGRE